jgi:glucose-6-phosphate 1-dehydrogenase
MLIRAGKCLAETFTEIRATLRRPVPALFDSATRPPNEVRFRLSPDPSITLSASVKRDGEAMVGDDASLIERAQAADDMAPYERLLGDALRGERALFGSEAGVEASWRIVEPVLGDPRPPAIYEPGSGGLLQSAREIQTSVRSGRGRGLFHRGQRPLRSHPARRVVDAEPAGRSAEDRAVRRSVRQPGARHSRPIRVCRAARSPA